MDINGLWKELCSYGNLFLAYKKARKHKTLKPCVIEFEKNLHENLYLLRTELLLHAYRPRPLKTFIIHDPKTRKISKSDFRDRVVHHAVCNIIEPIFDKSFIYDSYANRKGKGVLKALARFDNFKRKVSKNNTLPCFILKADVRHYFDNVDHRTLINILKKKVKDEKVIWLIKTILANHWAKEKGKGMPLGNLTSQFFANVYLNELDQYVKHTLKVRHYVRYVDDFVILDANKDNLKECKASISGFLKTIQLELHPDKSKIFKLERGVCFLGFRNYYHYKLLKKSNLHKILQKLLKIRIACALGKSCYDKAYAILEGWLAYSKTANTYRIRKDIIRLFQYSFPGQIAEKELNRWTRCVHFLEL